VLKAAGGNETMQENIQDWLELDEGDPEFQLFVFFKAFKYRFYSGKFIIIFISTIYIFKLFIF
jgi:hypothetical protein